LTTDPLKILTTAVPDLSEASAAELLRQHFAIEGLIESQDSERDRNFLVRQASGQEFVLKISNSAESEAITDLQTTALLHLERAHPDIPVPRVIPATNGAMQVRALADDGRTHTIRLLTWLPGVPLSKIEPRPDLATHLGAALGTLGRALKDLAHSASGYPLLWDIKQAGKLIPLLEHVRDKQLRDQCRLQFEKFVDQIEPQLRHCRSQIIHNDLNWGNVLADGKCNDRITGIIDFGDMVKSPLVIDIAVASAYLCKTGDEPLADVHKFLRGYHDVTPILSAEIELLPDLMLMRNVQTIVIANWRASQYPENREYLLCSVPDAKQMIATLGETSTTDIAENFKALCAAPRRTDA